MLATAEQHQLPFERVGSVRELASDAHAEARGMFPRVTQPGIGDVPVGRLALTMSTHERASLSPAPEIGEHTTDVLTEWLGAARLEALRASGALPEGRTERA